MIRKMADADDDGGDTPARHAHILTIGSGSEKTCRANTVEQYRGRWRQPHLVEFSLACSRMDVCDTLIIDQLVNDCRHRRYPDESPPNAHMTLGLSIGYRSGTLDGRAAGLVDIVCDTASFRRSKKRAEP
jgi:hypothetical protein